MRSRSAEPFFWKAETIYARLPPPPPPGAESGPRYVNGCRCTGWSAAKHGERAIPKSAKQGAASDGQPSDGGGGRSGPQPGYNSVTKARGARNGTVWRHKIHEAALAAFLHVPVFLPGLMGSINLGGSRIGDLRLKNYRLTEEHDPPHIELLNFAAVPDGYSAEGRLPAFCEALSLNSSLKSQTGP